MLPPETLQLQGWANTQDSDPSYPGTGIPWVPFVQQVGMITVVPSAPPRSNPRKTFAVLSARVEQAEVGAESLLLIPLQNPFGAPSSLLPPFRPRNPEDEAPPSTEGEQSLRS